MLPQPRTSKKSKRSSKRQSAPPQTLSNDLQSFKPATQSSQSTQPQTNNNDLLNLFDFSNDNNDTATNNNNNNNNSSNNDALLDLFEDTVFSAQSNSSKQQARNTVNTLQIHPSLLNPRESRSLQPDKLFDPTMWQNFDASNQQTANGHSKPNTNSNARNTTLNFEPINIEENKAKGKDDEDEEEEEDDEDEEEEEEDDEEEEEEAKKQATAAAKKPRASAPAITLSSVKEQKEKEPEKETNALEELHRGAALLKYPRRSGFPHFKHVQLSEDNLRIEWFSKRKSLDETCIYIRDIREVVRGQETEVFKKFHQKTLEKSSFSVVYGHQYKTLDVAAKSIDECEMWVKCLLKLCEIYKANKRESDLTACKEMYVGIHFKDRNRPMSRQGSGHFIRANSSKTLKIDPVALKEIERDMESLHKTYLKTSQLAQKTAITHSAQYKNIQYVLSELEERIEELSYEVANIRDTELAKREVWRANVDLSAIQEKVEVLLSRKNTKTDNRRKSNFM
mmetsp:Transcript_40427/g.64821  ORF Transcript_40427/g.64821 Transcript_40427/m.64821 type:complete len:508 (+) Transcript_40427:2038-3561(+)